MAYIQTRHKIMYHTIHVYQKNIVITVNSVTADTSIQTAYIFICQSCKTYQNDKHNISAIYCILSLIVIGITAITIITVFFIYIQITISALKVIYLTWEYYHIATRQTMRLHISRHNSNNGNNNIFTYIEYKHQFWM